MLKIDQNNFTMIIKITQNLEKESLHRPFEDNEFF